MKLWQKVERFFRSKKTSEPDMKKFLIVGLGNTGSKYQDTRHNIGFNVLNELADKENVLLKPKGWVILADSNIKEELLFFSNRTPL